MARLDLDAAARETLAEARAGMALYLPIAAAFAFLPNLLTARFGPPLPRTPADMTTMILLIDVALPAAIGAIGQLAIVRLALDKVRPTVGWALRHAVMLLPIVLLAALLSGAVVTAGLLALVLPGLYLAGRLALVLPVVAAEGGSAVGAVFRSWALTEGQGWRTFGFLLLWFVVFIIISIVTGGLGAAIGTVLTLSGAKAVGGLVVLVISSATAAVVSIYNAIAVAVVYRRLAATA